jgi:trehalose/maltose hydrolase-like predicted phosphorylase
VSGPWIVRAEGLDPSEVRARESVFTIGDGRLGIRGSTEEGMPGELRATWMHGVFDAAVGVHEELAAVPDPLPLEVRLGGEPFSTDTGTVLATVVELDLRTATLRRRVRWRSPGGREATLLFERFASLADAGTVVLRCTVIPAAAGPVEVRAWIDASPATLPPAPDDGPAAGRGHCTVVESASDEATASIAVRTRASGITVALASRLIVTRGREVARRSDASAGRPGVVVVAAGEAGLPVVVEKHVGISTSRELPVDRVVPVAVARAAAVGSWSEASVRHAAAWSDRWDRCDVEIEGDDGVTLAARFAMYHLQIAGPRGDDRVSIGAKALTGPGYWGHVFWDTDAFILPFFTHTAPEVARNLLGFRWHGLDAARNRAATEGRPGARFPWEAASDGAETTPAWLAHPDRPGERVRIWTGDLELHITADVAWAAYRHWTVTADDGWYERRGAELVIAAAAYLAARAERTADGTAFGFHDVIGPDEYHEHVDDNHFTNRMARWAIRAGQESWEWLQARDPARLAAVGERFGIHATDLAHWREVADEMHLPVRDDGLIEQFEGFFALEDVDLAAFEPRRQSMQSLLGIDGVQRTQAVKQPDVLMAMHLLPEEFGDEQVAANHAYYAPRTDHAFGSSLGPAIAALVACRAGRPEEALAHLRRAADMDLCDTRGNTAEGVHGAAAGGTWQAIVLGFAGLHRGPAGWATRPRLPAQWRRIRFAVTLDGEPRRFEVP